jgi:hypothetical protein
MIERPILYIDTEYNGFGGSLISLAIVALTGEEFYEVVDPREPWDTRERYFSHVEIDPWVSENVMPVLYKIPIRKAYFRSRLWDFLGRFDTPEIVCDWHEDLGHFCACLCGNDYDSSINYPFMATILTNTQPASDTPHNALADARALRAWCRATYNY